MMPVDHPDVAKRRCSRSTDRVRRPFYALLYYAQLLWVALVAPVCGAELSTPSTNSTPSTESGRLIYLATERPYILAIQISLDGVELRQARRRRLDKVFSELDRDQDGVVSAVERDQAPHGLRSLGLRLKWRELVPLLDLSPQDDQISQQEFADFCQQRLGEPLRLMKRVRNVRRSSQAVELFDLLDEDQNGAIEPDEFEALAKRLHKLDADGDDAFSVIEVEPFRNPFAARIGSPNAPERSPWLLVMETADAAQIEPVFQRWDRLPTDGQLTPAELQQSAESIAAFDEDRNGALSPPELLQWLARSPADFTMSVTLPQRQRGTTGVVWTDHTQPVRDTGRATAHPTRNLDVTFDRQPLELRVSANKASQSDNVTFYRLQFRRADADKNKYLSATEFAALGLPGATFEHVDMDGNGELYDKELVEFLNLENRADQGHVMIAWDSNEVSLFALLDTDRDNRLSPRECQAAARRWREFDRNQDSRIDRQELAGNLRLAIEFVKPRLFMDAAAGSMSPSQGEPILRQRTDGPRWFRGMDRNQDGDVSELEFLGTRATFQKWDRNGDQFISVEEAEAGDQ